MTFAQLLMLAAVVVCSALSARPWPVRFVNPTGAALVTAYFAVQIAWLAQHELVSPFALFYLDLGVLAVLYGTKPETPHRWCRDSEDARFYRSMRRQLCALWLERSPADRVVIACFPVAWWFYGVHDPWRQWWALWAIGMIQLLAASTESYLTRRREAKAAQPSTPDYPSSRLAMARGWAGDG